jgi:hypothetical protein
VHVVRRRCVVIPPPWCCPLWALAQCVLGRQILRAEGAGWTASWSGCLQSILLESRKWPNWLFYSLLAAPPPLHAASRLSETEAASPLRGAADLQFAVRPCEKPAVASQPPLILLRAPPPRPPLAVPPWASTAVSPVDLIAKEQLGCYCSQSPPQTSSEPKRQARSPPLRHTPRDCACGKLVILF